MAGVRSHGSRIGFRTPERPNLSEVDLELWRRYIASHCGVDFGRSRAFQLSRCLWERMTAKGIFDYGAYYRHVTCHPHGGDELAPLIELLMNHETRFYRHPPSFNALGQVLLPELVGRMRDRQDRTLRIWSAGCSTGEEPYSLALKVLDGGFLNHPQVEQCRIWGSDISSEALRSARQGRYRGEQLSCVPEAEKRLYFAEVSGGEGMAPRYRLNGAVRDLVQFGRFNLCSPGQGWAAGQDVIFCQNVLIYFRAEVRNKVLWQLSRCLLPLGYLVLGPGEAPGLRLDDLRSVPVEDCSIYQRVG